ncbi:hypothetical protein ABZ759_26240 [Streptomyces sp. NPDC047860]|uniref:hypothetical protein n=1 Tax=Streptomyces sp. NPDC047860 TaxID=3155743 RepID=UPI0033F2B432
MLLPTVPATELLDEAADLQKYRLAYDQVRDLAPSPSESVAFIERVIGEDADADPLARETRTG